MISQEIAQFVEGLTSVSIPGVNQAWHRIGEIDRELVKNMIPAVRQRRLSERKGILNKLRISYT